MPEKCSDLEQSRTVSRLVEAFRKLIVKTICEEIPNLAADINFKSNHKELNNNDDLSLIFKDLFKVFSTNDAGKYNVCNTLGRHSSNSCSISNTTNNPGSNSVFSSPRKSDMSSTSTSMIRDFSASHEDISSASLEWFDDAINLRWEDMSSVGLVNLPNDDDEGLADTCIMSEGLLSTCKQGSEIHGRTCKESPIFSPVNGIKIAGENSFGTGNIDKSLIDADEKVNTDLSENNLPDIKTCSLINHGAEKAGSCFHDDQNVTGRYALEEKESSGIKNSCFEPCLQACVSLKLDMREEYAESVATPEGGGSRGQNLAGPGFVGGIAKAEIDVEDGCGQISAPLDVRTHQFGNDVELNKQSCPIQGKVNSHSCSECRECKSKEELVHIAEEQTQTQPDRKNAVLNVLSNSGASNGKEETLLDRIHKEVSPADHIGSDEQTKCDVSEQITEVPKDIVGQTNELKDVCDSFVEGKKSLNRMLEELNMLLAIESDDQIDDSTAANDASVVKSRSMSPEKKSQAMNSNSLAIVYNFDVSADGQNGDAALISPDSGVFETSSFKNPTTTSNERQTGYGYRGADRPRSPVKERAEFKPGTWYRDRGSGSKIPMLLSRRRAKTTCETMSRWPESIPRRQRCYSEIPQSKNRSATSRSRHSFVRQSRFSVSSNAVSPNKADSFSTSMKAKRNIERADSFTSWENRALMERTYINYVAEQRDYEAAMRRKADLDEIRRKARRKQKMVRARTFPAGQTHVYDNRNLNDVREDQDEENETEHTDSCSKGILRLAAGEGLDSFQLNMTYPITRSKNLYRFCTLSSCTASKIPVLLNDC